MKEVHQNVLSTAKKSFCYSVNEDGFYYTILVNILMGGKLCPPAKLLYLLCSPNLSTTTAIYFDKNDHYLSFGLFEIRLIFNTEGR